MRRVFAREAGLVGIRFHTFAPRPNKLAAGMTVTLVRSKLAALRRAERESFGFLAPGDDGASSSWGSNALTLQLAVKGTLDPLARGLGGAIRSTPCSCCGAPRRGGLKLTEMGQRRLRMLRKVRRLALMYGDAP